MKVKFIINALLGLTLVNAKLIMLIRHGEKINDDYTDLSPEGKARAECLINTFGPNGIYATPQIIYAQKPTKQRQSTRPVDTVTPLAESLGLEVDLSYSSGKFKDLAKEIKKSPEEVILVSWANDRIPKIAKEFGIKKVPEWKGKEFDDVWIITDGTTSYIRDATVDVNLKKTYKGKKDFTMEVVSENVEQCMAQVLGEYSSSITTRNNANSNDSSTINTNKNANSNDSINNESVISNEYEIDSSSEAIKVSTMTLTILLSMIFYLFN